MITIEHTQSGTEFSQSPTETIERLNHTGEVEFLTIDGETRAVILSPALYKEMAREALITRDVEAMKASMEQIRRGEDTDADEFFNQQYERLLKMQADRAKDSSK